MREVALSITSESVSMGMTNDAEYEEDEKEEEKPNNWSEHFYEIIRKFTTALYHKNVKEITAILKETNKVCGTKLQLLSDKEIRNKINDDNSRNTFKNKIIDLMLTEFNKLTEINSTDSLFWNAAKFDLNLLQEIVRNQGNLRKETFHESRDFCSVIVFALKYGNVVNDNFLSCMELLIEIGVDVNIHDFTGKTAIDYIALLFRTFEDASTSTALKNIAWLLLKKGIYKSENKNTEAFLREDMNLSAYKYHEMDTKSKLFYLLVTNHSQKLLEMKEIENYINEEIRNFTFLQLLCKKSDHMFPIVQYLLKHGADPNKKIENNQLTPLQLAAYNNNQKIFEELLKEEKTEVTKEEYNQFVQWRCNPVKAKLFELLLESNKLNVDFTYDKTGNTPLHYAVLFSHKKAIQTLLQRNSSLIVKNKMKKSVLDFIDAEDLETYFDCCLAFDNYTQYFSDFNYKMKFRFNCLVATVQNPKPSSSEINVMEANKKLVEGSKDLMSKEMKVMSQIGRQTNLEYLLTHPLIETFLSLKWSKIKIYLWIVLLFQAIIFLLLSVLFYRLPFLGTVEFCSCILVSVINILIKVPIFLYFKLENNRPKFLVLDQATLHGSVELLLVITIIGSFIQTQFRAFLFIEMAISFLLTMGYHPNLSKWSIMLQTVFQTFSVLFIFFSFIIVAFSAGFHILLPSQEGFFGNFTTAIFKTYIMTTGEFNIDESTNFGGFYGYLLYIIFAMSMALVIVNFWTGVAVTDIERIEKNSEINASRNVILFMSFIEFLYNFSPTIVHETCKRWFPNPSIFLHRPDQKSKNKYEIDFYVNKEKQFDSKNVSGLPKRISTDCFGKIKRHYYNKINKSNEEKVILKELEEITKKLNKLISEQDSRKGTEDSKQKTNGNNKWKKK